MPATSPETGVTSPAISDLDRARVAVLGTGGTVARYPGILAVYAASAAAGDRRLQEFLDICAEVSDGDGDTGRRLARRLSVWLAGMDEPPCLGTVAVTQTSLAVFLSGPARLEFGDGAPALSGADSAAWLDRVIEWPGRSFSLTVGPAESAVVPDLLDLRSGVVAGSGAAVVPASVVVLAKPAASVDVAPSDPSPAEPERAEPVMAELVMAEPERPEPVMAEPVMAEPERAEPERAEPVMAEPELGPPVPAPMPTPTPAPAPTPMTEQPTELARPALRPPARSSVIFGAGNPEPPREPLPIAGADSAEAPVIDTGANPQVHGFLCSRGHLNDPRALFCGLCGIRMAERTGILTLGRRPPLGLLVFDDGTTFTVDSGYLLGRDPESDERVMHGGLRPLVIIDTQGAVSRRHALVELDGWNVLVSDAGSANGTFIAERGAEAWSALVPQRPVAMQAGTRVRIGTRTFVFETPNGGA